MTRANIVWILLAVVLGVLGGAAYTTTRPVLYASASTGMVVVPGAVDSFSTTSIAAQKAQSYLPLLNGAGVRSRIATELGSVPGSMSAYVLENTASIVITVSVTDPAIAAPFANTAMKALGEEAFAVESLGSTVTPAAKVFILYDAQPPVGPYSPNWRTNLVAGAVVGLALGYAFAFLRRALDGRIRYTTDVEEITERGTLGVIPKSDALEKQRKTGQRETGIAAEALRQLRTNLRFVRVDDPPRSIVVTSCNPSEGKSTVSSNLARLLAEAGHPTVLVDADLRRPTVHERFKVDKHLGLTQVLVGDVPLADVLQTTDTPGLLVVSAGRIPPNPSELLGSQRMHQVVDELRATHTVILDAPPMLPVTDAQLLTRATDGAIVVIAVGKTFKEQLRLAVKLFKQIDGRLLGSVLNMAPQRGMGSIMYGYGYGGYHRKYSKYGGYGDTQKPKTDVPEIIPPAPVTEDASSPQRAAH